MNFDSWDIPEYFNFLESIIWFYVSFFVYKQSKLDKYIDIKSLQQRMSLFFIIFAITDLIEISTGAWYSPWWLCLIKVACALFLIYGFYRWFKFDKLSK